jgi:phosphoribosyl 1,2-cyclic phosphate phosphodiesterase
VELIFLGTGAAEGAPAAYCRCATCQGVRERGGVELRTRSSLRIGAHHQIDVSPDQYRQTLAAGTDMFDVEHALITHTHEDHFTLTALTDKQMSQETNDKPLAVYLSEPGRAYVEKMVAAVPLSAKDLQWLRRNIVFIGLEYFHEYAIGGFTVQTVKGNHAARGENEHSINYLVGLPGGRKLLYTCDSGYYREETWEYLAGKRVDTLILECTAVYATHFNPHQGLSHFEVSTEEPTHPYVDACPVCGLTGEYAFVIDPRSQDYCLKVHDPLGVELLLHGTIRGTAAH